MSLEDYGVTERGPSIREVARQAGEIVDPTAGDEPISYTRGAIEIPVRALADRDLRHTLEDAGVETLRSRGYESFRNAVRFPETVSGPDASGCSSRMIGVRVRYQNGGSDWIPVRRDDLEPADDLEGALSDAAADGGTNDRDAPQNPTRVGHVNHDEIDVYAGRGDGGDAHLLNTEPGEPGWLGNPYTVEDFGREEAVAMFAHALLQELENRPALRRALGEEIRGQVLGCYCQRLEDDSPSCHAEVIARVADDVLVPPTEGGQA